MGSTWEALIGTMCFFEAMPCFFVNGKVGGFKDDDDYHTATKMTARTQEPTQTFDSQRLW